MKLTLKGPVGDLSRSIKRGNIPEDVKAVKQVLMTLGIAPELGHDANAHPSLVVAIRKFQKLFLPNPDGRIDPAPGGTLRRLNELAGGKAIVVNLNRQVLDAFSSLNRVYHFDCAAGDAQHPTPPGYFAIQAGRKHAKYRSKTYDAQMDYAMFFHQGYAIHMAYMVGVTSLL
jgi:lipoprotein-anchoring transpeptidase ErfK/SrfK